MNSTPPRPTPDDDAWDDLLDAWRHDPPTTAANDAKPPLLPQDERLMRRATHKLLLKLGGEYAAAAAVMAAYALLLNYHTTPHLLALAAASAMFLLLYLAVMTRTFWHTLRPAAHTTEAYLALTRRRLAAEHRWAAFVQLASAAFGLFILAWAAAFIATQESPLRTLAAVALPLTAVFAILAAVIYFARRQQLQRRRQLQDLQEATPPAP